MFLLYIDNPGGAVSDVSVRDILEPGFAYVPGSIRTDGTLSSSATCPGGVCDDAAIFARVDGSGTPLGDGIGDGDVASYDGPGRSVELGNQNQAGNAQLDLSAGRVWAVRFSVRVQ